MDQELSSNTDIAKSNGILRMYIGFVQRERSNKLEECSLEDCITLLDWLSSNQIDVNKKDWYRTEDGRVIPQLRTYEKSPKKWIWALKGMLPILLKCNGNINFVDESEKNVLHVFLEDYFKIYDFERNPFGFEIDQMVEYLMAKGISVEAADENGNTPLHIAAKHRKVDLIQIMLKNYININARNNQGDTVLHILYSEICDKSTAAHIEECAQSMLLKGADVNLRNQTGWTPVHFAVKRNNLGLLKNLLCGGANLNLLTNDGESPLLISCKYTLYVNERNRSMELIRLLINEGCDVNATDRYGCSPLHYACKSFREMIFVSIYEDVGCILSGVSVYSLEPLVTAGADVNAETLDGETPLLLVALSGSFEAVEYLSREGANMLCHEKIFGFTALHMAVLQFHGKNLEYLLKQEFDVNDGSNYGVTPLHLASFRGNLQGIEMLIARGADVHCRDKLTRSTALHFAAIEGDILDYVSSICDVEGKPFWDAGSFYDKNSEDAIALLVRNGADVNARDVHGKTPLHMATMYAKREPTEDGYGYSPHEDINTIRGLLTCGAYIDVQDDEGNTPLHNALKTGHGEALETLLAFGVDVNEVDTCRIVSSCRHNLKNQVFRYLVKLNTAQLPVSSAYSSRINGPEFQLLYNACFDEVKKMKTLLINETTSIYDLLHMGWRRRLNFAQKLPADLKDKFPLYAGIIQASFRETEQRKLLLEPAKLGWYRITEVNLFDVCVERILAHLKNRYLRILSEGLSEDCS